MNHINLSFLLVLLMAVAGTFGGLFSHSFSHSHEYGHHHHGLIGGGGFNPYGGYYQQNHWGRKK
ncbi:hypothetical protein CAEBREN_32567 [Caenorhabditis brenneri]|uniref:Uncharacterized protein n=1 Tax=Caenorhabditis brenneri TaxID=135651 RepID=G0NUU3_CAEBE|nr:hypothetical protein CAEBREN_31507 [Caenorhabditis brenneri]EGT39665.1 hypothetical protein CAEBREN_32567 [Caenorhabditis brenneri]